MLSTVNGWHYQYVGQYLKWARTCFAATALGSTVRIWGGEDLDADGFRREFVKAVHQRINLKAMLPIAANAREFVKGKWAGWRKLDSDYQISLWRDSRRLRDIANRIRVYQFETKEARSRFGHLLAAREAF